MSGFQVSYGGLAVLAAVTLSCSMTIATAIQRRTGNSGWIDTIWSSSVGLTAVAAVVLSGPMTPHRWLIVLLVAAWSARLAAHIFQRTRTVPDDPRYRALITAWGRSAAWRLWMFLQVQAAAGVVLVMCAVVAAAWSGAVGPWHVACYVLALAALVGESAADAQLRAFKERRQSADAICDTGLWAYSRHPNYFFEWLFWLSISLTALSFDRTHVIGWLALAAPVMMYAVLVHGSGVPHSEAHMLRTRGARFAEYQKRVPMFFPDPRRLFRGRP